MGWRSGEGGGDFDRFEVRCAQLVIVVLMKRRAPICSPLSLSLCARVCVCVCAHKYIAKIDAKRRVLKVCDFMLLYASLASLGMLLMEQEPGPNNVSIQYCVSSSRHSEVGGGFNAERIGHLHTGSSSS